MEMVSLNLGAAPTEAELEKMKGDKLEFNRRWANRLLSESQSGKPFIHRYPFPLQAWRLGASQLGNVSPPRICEVRPAAWSTVPRSAELMAASSTR